MKTIERKPNPGLKTACVVRYGAFGDALWCGPVFEELKKEGYYVIFNCTSRCYQIQRHNPFIDCFWLQEDNEVGNIDLGPYWEKLRAKVDKFVNLSGTIEGNLLRTPDQSEYRLPKEERHALYNRNYQDETMIKAGFPDKLGLNPSFYLDEKEEEWARKFREKNKGFLVVYSLSGSSLHKTYPYAGSVIEAMLDGLPDAVVVCVGEPAAQGIITPHPRLIDLCGKLGIRKSMALTKIADLVVSTETSIANAASCFETPKIVLLSHSSEENLTKYWKNCFSIVPPVTCFPCHQLHYDKNSCPIEEQTQFPVCVALLHPKLILEKAELVYNHWRSTRLQIIS